MARRPIRLRSAVRLCFGRERIVRYGAVINTSPTGAVIVIALFVK